MDFWKKVKKLASTNEELYIYGAGLYGQNIYRALKKKNITVDGFVITIQSEETFMFGLPVLEFKSIKNADVGIIAGVNRHNAVAVRKTLESADFNMEKVVWGYELIDNQAVRGGYDEIPTIEITTRIGCAVNCKFCPQDTLIKKYFERDLNRPFVMSLDTFSKCLKKMPQNCTILFSGMAEPFLNPECLEMMKLAASSGRTVDLYTTLVGTSPKLIKQISEIPFGFVTLHLADKHGYAHIPISDQYYLMLEELIHLKKKDGSPFVNMCNAQAEPDARILELCDEKYEILTTMLDRAGNLNDLQLFRKECLSGPISCSLCGQKLNHNILLPDGTILLCCMDYGMKHVLGNLLESSYEEIMNGAELQRIKKGLSGNLEIDILCRHCSCANLIMDENLRRN